jgi:hypothetical protein
MITATLLNVGCILLYLILLILVIKRINKICKRDIRMLGGGEVQLKDYYKELFGSPPKKEVPEVPKVKKERPVKPNVKPKRPATPQPVKPSPEPLPSRKEEKEVQKPEPKEQPKPEPKEQSDPPKKEKKPPSEKQLQHRKDFSTWKKAKSGKSFTEWKAAIVV